MSPFAYKAARNGLMCAQTCSGSADTPGDVNTGFIRMAVLEGLENGVEALLAGTSIIYSRYLGQGLVTTVCSRSWPSACFCTAHELRTLFTFF